MTHCVDHKRLAAEEHWNGRTHSGVPRRPIFCDIFSSFFVTCIQKKEPLLEAAESKNLMHRKWVMRDDVSHFVFVLCFKDHQRSCRIGKGATQYHHPVFKKSIHEGGMLFPVRLFAHGLARNPGRTRFPEDDKRVSHLVSFLMQFHFSVTNRCLLAALRSSFLLHVKGVYRELRTGSFLIPVRSEHLIFAILPLKKHIL